MGVLNVTPDSFSDGGLWTQIDSAIEHGIALHAAGADLVDVGGESTRPGAHRIDSDEERARVLPVLTGLIEAGVPCSIDTTHSSVAAAALDAGVQVVNDVSGGLADPAMAGVVRAAGCPWILMHWRGQSDQMAHLAHYSDVVTDVCTELLERVQAAERAGVDPAMLVLDPGLGFAKTAEHNWALLGALPRLEALGFPLLVGASRKSFLGHLLARPDGTPRPVTGREDATTAITTVCAQAGVWGVRVHDVQASVDAAMTVAAIDRAGT